MQVREVEYYLNKYLSCCIFLLLRPINDREKKQNSCSVIECNEKRKEITVSDRIAGTSNPKTFTFDRVFGQASKQIEVYNHVVRPVVLEVVEGYNCTIFA